MARPCEANVVYSEHEDKRVIRVIKMCGRLGYKSIVLNNVWKDNTITVQTEKRKQKGKQNKPQAPQIVSALKLKQLKHHPDLIKKDLSIYSRFTLVLEDASQLRMLQKDEVVLAYDIIAVQPVNEKMCDLACKSLDVDIITFGLNEKLPFYLTRPKIRMAVERGIHFEICYTPMLVSREARRYTISNGQVLVDFTKGKNIILSGANVEEMDVRGPYDVANLGTLFYLNLEQCRNAVTRNCQQMILHAESRKSALGIIKMQSRSEVKEEWFLKQSQLYDESEVGSENSSSEDEDSPTKRIKVVDSEIASTS